MSSKKSDFSRLSSDLRSVPANAPRARHRKTFFGIRAGLFFLLLTGLLIGGFVAGAQILRKPVSSAESPKLGEKNKGKNFDNADIRVNAKNNLGQIAEVRALAKSGRFSSISDHAKKSVAKINDALTELKASHPDVQMELSPQTGAVEKLYAQNGLSNINPGRSGEDIVREFITGNRDLYGLNYSEINDLHFFGESRSQESSLRMIRVEQMVEGRPVFQSETRFILDGDGRIIESLGAMIPEATAKASRMENLLSPQQALRLTTAQFDISLDEKSNVGD